MQRNFRCELVIVTLLCLCIATPGAAQPPRLISLQGQLADEFSETLPDDDYQLSFSIYAQPVDGLPLWTETQTVALKAGIYNVVLGSLVSMDLPFDEPYYLGVQVEADGEMVPRLPLVSTAYARRAAEADAVADGAVTSTMLAVGAVVTDAVADNAITAVKVADGPGSDLDADLLDGQSAEAFLGVTGGTVDGLLTLEGAIGPQLVIHDNGSTMERPGVQFTGNNIHFIAGDDLSNEYFGFYAGFSNNRTYDANLRVHGKATDSWARFIGLTHDGSDGTIETDSGDIILDPADDVRIASGKGVVYPDGSRQTTAYTASLETRVASLESEIAALKALLLNVTRTGNDIRFNGVNLHVNNGTGTTNGTVNGLGNLIVGYNELRTTGNVRTGSHNVIVGRQQNFSSFGGLMAGETNTTSGIYACVTGGVGNIASGAYASVTGGGGNTAGSLAASVSGGTLNEATGEYASVSGGEDNTASGLRSSVSGGYQNSATFQDTWVGGGEANSANGLYASITGGAGNDATGEAASVTGGFINHGEGFRSSISGGRYSTASGNYASVSGGRDNTASGLESSVSGGADNTASHTQSSVSGGNQNEANGTASSVSGGFKNSAGGQESSVSGGDENTASGIRASVTAGWQNTASALCASVTAGQGNTATSSYSSITGGYLNSADDYWATVSGGSERSVDGQMDWRAGDLFQEQ